MTEAWHISEELLGRFLQNDVSKAEARRVVRHLARGCPECTGLAHRLTVEAGLWGRGMPEQAYEEVFERALAFATAEEQRLALERLLGWGQWVVLESLNPQTRFAMVEAEASFHTFGFYDRLIDTAKLYARREPAEAVDIVRLAILVAERLDPERFGRGRVADVRTTAWAELGNMKRLASDFEGSRRAFNEAWQILEEEGTGDPLVRARLISLEASYINDIGEFETAESVLEEALEIYRSVRDSHLQGRILFKMGDVIGHIDPERGLDHIRKALSLLDMEREPRLELCARHDLAWYLNDSGKPEEALSLLEASRFLYKQFSDSYTQMRLHWLEGRIARSLGKLEESENTFRQLWEELRTRGLHHELVLVSIDLAETLAAKGELRAAAKLAGECYPIFEGWGIHRYALSTWLFFGQLLAEEKIEEAMFRRLGEYYRRHWVKPGVFEPAAVGDLPE